MRSTRSGRTMDGHDPSFRPSAVQETMQYPAIDTTTHRRSILLVVCLLSLAIVLASLGVARALVAPPVFGDAASDRAALAVVARFYDGVNVAVSTGHVEVLDRTV